MDVKRYINVATVFRDGLLVVVQQDSPSSIASECIIVSRQVLHGLLTALHILLGNPTLSQVKHVVRRLFCALDMDKAIEEVASGVRLFGMSNN